MSTTKKDSGWGESYIPTGQDIKEYYQYFYKNPSRIEKFMRFFKNILKRMFKFCKVRN